MTRKIDIRKPCLNCTFETGRTLTCHDTCKYYLANKELEEKIKKKAREDSDYREYVGGTIRRFNKGKDREKKHYSQDPRSYG